MNNVYLISFAVGLLYTMVSTIISGISGIMDIGGHIGHSIESAFGSGQAEHGTIDGSHGGDSNFHFLSVILNPLVAVSFLTVFGGIGIVGSNLIHILEPFNVALAILAAVAVSTVLYKFVVVPIYLSENSTDVSRDALTGVRAVVVSAILENGFGEISYTVNSLKYNAPAKHLEGKAMKQGENVIIVKVEDNVFYVSGLEQI